MVLCFCMRVSSGSNSGCSSDFFGRPFFFGVFFFARSVDSLSLLLALMFFVLQNGLYQMQGFGIKEVMGENHGITKLTTKRDFSALE